MQRNMFQVISKWIGFRYTDTVLEFVSGKQLRLRDMEDVRFSEGEREMRAEASAGGYRMELCFRRIEADVYSCSAALKAEGKTEDKLHKIITMRLSMPYDGATCFVHRGDGRRHRLCEAGRTVSCRDVCSFFTEGAESDALTLTARLPEKFRTQVDIVKYPKSVSLSVSTTLPYSYEGDVVCQEWELTVHAPTADALIRSAERCGMEQELPAPIGWSTWDYYFTSATEDDVKENVDFIAADPELSKKVRYIALDDGWQQSAGDWREGIRYPSGLKSLVSYIRDKGFEAGIWISPTRMHNLCATVMRRNDFLVRNEYGDPLLDGPMHVLDPTHPDGERFLRETFAYLADCGFTFYKLDFISNLYEVAERFYDKSAGPFDALAKLIEIVRSTVPEGSHIMGCSLPFGMGAGHVDSRRTSWDIHNSWKQLLLSFSGYVLQFAANERIYRNDLDYLVVRGPDTSDDTMMNVLNPLEKYYAANPSDELRWRDGTDFSYNEAKLWCAIVLMSGSSIFLGDRLSLLKPNGLELIKQTLRHADFCAAVPVFAGAGSFPEIWYKPETGKLAVLNLSEKEKEYALTPSEWGIKESRAYTDVFTKKTYASDGGTLKLRLDAHDCVYLEPDGE